MVVRERAHAALLRRTVRALADASTDPREVLQTLARQVAASLDAMCGIMRVSGDTLQPVAHGAPPSLVDHDISALLVMPIDLAGDTLAARTVRSGETTCVAAITEAHAEVRYPDPADRARLLRFGLGAGLFVPVTMHDRVVGVLSLLRRGHEAVPFDEAEIEFAEQLADLAALVFTSSRLVDEARDRTVRLEQLASLTRELGGASDSYQLLLDVIARRLGETLADSCAIRMLRGDEENFAPHVAVYNRDPALAARYAEMLRDMGTRINEGVVTRALATRRTIRAPQVDLPALLAETTPVARAVLAELAPTTFMVVPICTQDSVLAVLLISRGPGQPPFSEADEQLVDGLAAHAAIAIANAQLIERITRSSERNSALLDDVKRELAERTRAETALRESEERLRHAQKMEAIGRLAGGVAHDFNNLLSIVLSSCDFIVEAEPSQVVLGDVAQIRRAGERAAELTRQLLAFSRQQPIEPQVLELNAQVEQVRGMFTRLLGEDIALVTELAPELGTVVVDATHLEQVMMNLAINARDAMPRGGTLTVRTDRVVIDEREAARLREVRPGPFVRLTVTDTGEGMTPDQLDRIFEPFFTTKPRGKGTGLGLSTVFGIVTQNGGAIRATSEPGRGTTFEVFLPLTQRPVTARKLAPLKVATGNGETILVAEDEDGVRRMVVEILRRNGYRVIETANGREALDAFEREDRVDLVLTDVVMPAMSGGELVSRLRAKRPGIKVLYMSGYPDDAYLRQHPLEQGSPLLAKPLERDPVLRKVREVLGS